MRQAPDFDLLNHISIFVPIKDKTQFMKFVMLHGFVISSTSLGTQFYVGNM